MVQAATNPSPNPNSYLSDIYFVWEKWFAVFAKLSFDFNYNLVESWDGYVLNFPNTQPPTTHPEKYGMTSASTANFDNNFNNNF